MEDDFDNDATHGTEDRPRGVPKAKLSDIDLGPKLSIFYRPHRNAPMMTLEASFSKEAAKIFCDRIKSEFEGKSSHSYVITGGEQSAYKMIFSWIKDCVQTQSIEKFPDIPEPEDDPFTATINVIVAGDKLGVPAGSLGVHLRKRLRGCARKQLMPLAQVRETYEVGSDIYELDLRDVACSSVFNAWWDARLDESVNPELMEELSDMRDDLKELDSDLHEACKTREQEIRKKWAEKRAKKEAEQAGSGNDFNDAVAGTDDNAQGGRWDNVGAAASDAWNSTPTTAGDQHASADGSMSAPLASAGDWENQNSSSMTNDINDNWARPEQVSENTLGQGDDEAVVNKNWADEMEDSMPAPVHHVPLPRW